MKKRKKGAIALYSIFIIITLLVLASILFNLQQGMQMVTRMNQAAEEGAKVRAQAVDILLKEQEGIIEILHDSTGYEDNVTHDEHVDVAGHVSPQLPQSAAYQKAKKKADAFSRESVLSYVKNSIYTDTTGKKTMVELTANDICFDFQPLPGDSIYDKDFDPENENESETDMNEKEKLDFSCVTPNGDTITADNVAVSNTKKNTVKVGDKNGKAQTVRVANVVFIGIHFDYSYYFGSTMEKLGASRMQSGQVWSIAYPQPDKCVRSDESCSY